MTTLTRADFLQEMSSVSINVAQAQDHPLLSSLNWGSIDRDDNQVVTGRSEMKQLYRLIDRLDSNGSYYSIDLGSTASPTEPGKIIQSLREFIASPPEQPPVPEAIQPLAPIDLSLYRIQDTALKNAFGAWREKTYQKGDRGKQVVAIQYALGRLGYLKDPSDGSFGPITGDAVEAFQEASSLPKTRTVESNTFLALDKAVSPLDLRTPALKSGADPMEFLSNFQALGMPAIEIDRRDENVTWDSPSIQKAYGEFVENYWEILKENRVEADCKALALFFMDQFRKQLEADTFIVLPLPKSRHGSFREQEWWVSTRNEPRGIFSRVYDLFRRLFVRVRRRNYRPVKMIQELDPSHSMIYGVNVKYPRTSAHQVSRAATTVIPWQSSFDNRGDYSKPEVPINRLKPGHMLFMDHRGDGRYDHTVNIVKVKRDDSDQVRQLVMAVGSYDDVRDSSSATQVTSMEMVNQYSEEVVVDFDETGHITQSKVTFSSEPPYLVKPRYHARNTLMERNSRGKIKVSRWG